MRTERRARRERGGAGAAGLRRPRRVSRLQPRTGPRRAPEHFPSRWLTPRPMTLTFEPASGALVFKELLCRRRREPALVSELKALVDDHGGRAVPAHRRIDARRMRAACSVRGGQLTLRLTGARAAPRVRRAARAESGEPVVPAAAGQLPRISRRTFRAVGGVSDAGSGSIRDSGWRC